MSFEHFSSLSLSVSACFSDFKYFGCFVVAHTVHFSRYWLSAGYEERLRNGQEPQNIDKEFLRRWFVERCDPYKDATLPEVPPELTCELSRR